MGIKRRTIASSSVNLVDYGLRFVAMLVVSPVLIHGLGAETYGQWIVLLSLIGYVDLLDLGMSGAAVRYLSLEIGDQKVDGVAEALTFFRRIFRWISLVAGALVFVGVMLLPHLARDVTSGCDFLI